MSVLKALPLQRNDDVDWHNPNKLLSKPASGHKIWKCPKQKVQSENLGLIHFEFEKQDLQDWFSLIPNVEGMCAWGNPEQDQLQGELETAVQCAVQEDGWHHSNVSWGVGGAVSDEKCCESGMVAQWLDPWFGVCLCYISVVSPDKVSWMWRFF